MALKTVTIAGGGLAGLALGIGLRQHGVPVMVLEASNYPRHRVCGEFVSGIESEVLHDLGIRDLFGAALRPRETAWFDRDRLFYRGTLPEAAYGVSRHFLDDALAERFRSMGGVLKTGVRFDGDPIGEGTVLAAGRVVTAGAAKNSGRSASSGRLSGRRAWFGLKAHYAELECVSDLEVHLGDHSYVGVTAVENGWVNVTGLFREGMGTGVGENRMERAVAEAGLRKLAARLGAARFRPGSLKGVNRFELGWQSGFGRGIRIGDAAAMIAPVTGNGMTMALQGAWMALEPVLGWSRGDWEWNAAEHRVVRDLQHRFSARLRWASGLQRVLMTGWSRRVCGLVLDQGWVSFDTLYRMVR
jgi:2-polyprenyl-6-methoxyphenol hydroxylase-like FAD-dependent oxidoreductase